MNSKSLPLFRGELALCIAVLMNSFGVVLMLYSGAGISAISSVPFAFSEVWPVLSRWAPGPTCSRGAWCSA